MRTAVLVDGAFFLWRYRSLLGSQPPEVAANDLHRMCCDHLHNKLGRSDLYRIFYYDCPPLQKNLHHPLTKKHLKLAETPLALWRLAFLERLKRLRKVALRLGYISDTGSQWVLKAGVLKKLLAGVLTVEAFTETDLKYEVKQKGVDMRIGLDIASLAYKRLVDQIILVSGDSDFVPAAKLARREGIDFVLDPMWSSVAPDLHEHIDGLKTVIPKPNDGTPVTVHPMIRSQTYPPDLEMPS